MSKILFGLAITLLCVNQLSAQNQDKVVIYQHAYYEGAKQELGIGKYNAANLSIGDNQLSSIRIPKNMRITLYENADFKGNSIIFTEDSDYVYDFNDLTSSIIVEYAPSATTATKPSFTGCPTGEENLPAQNEAFEKRVWEIVNIERAKLGKPAMAWNSKLARAARYHAIDMLTDGYFAHDSHDIIDGKKVKVCETFDRINKFAPGFAENIAGGNPTPEEAMQSWMNSPGHYANIMSDNASIGVGFYNNIWVQVFGPKE